MELRDREQGDRRLGCSSITDRWALGHVHDSRVERKRAFPKVRAFVIRR